MRMMKCRMAAILSSFVFWASPMHAQREPTAPVSAHYSIQESTTGNEWAMRLKKSFFIGEYGETFSYFNDWILHTPRLSGGIEVIRFHSALDDFGGPKRVVPESAFENPENYSALGLTQLLVIPANAGGFQEFSELRASKIKELTGNGVKYEIFDGASPQGFWPENTFQVSITSPYRLHQVYVQSEGRLFILTGGLDEKGSGKDRFGMIFVDEFVSSLGDYFEALHRAPHVMQLESYDSHFRGLRGLSLPLLGCGLLLWGLWSRKQFTRPIAYACMTASLASIVLHAAGFFAARQLSSIQDGMLVSPGRAGWVIIPLVLSILFYRSRDLTFSRKWIVRSLSLLAAVILIFITREAAREILSGEKSIAADFSLYLFWVGILDGACFGLTIGKGDKPAKSAAMYFMKRPANSHRGREKSSPR